MSKIYLRKVKGSDCKKCYFNNNNCKFPKCGQDHIYKKITAKESNKLLKSGKCKIVEKG